MKHNLSDPNALEKVYNTFASYCNENPISAVADLTVNKWVIEEHLTELNSEVEERYQEVTELFNFKLKTEEFRTERDNILVQILESISNEDHIYDPNHILKLEDITREFYKRTIPNPKPMRDPAHSIAIETTALTVRTLSHIGHKIRHASEIIRAVDFIIGTVISQRYIGEGLQLWEDLPDEVKEKVRPHNYRGDLTKKCIQDLKKLAELEPEMKVHKFFKTAHSRYPSCRKARKDGKLEKIGYRALMEKTKKTRPDLYYRDIKNSPSI